MAPETGPLFREGEMKVLQFKKQKPALICAKCGYVFRKGGRDFRGKVCDSCAFPGAKRLKRGRKP